MYTLRQINSRIKTKAKCKRFNEGYITARKKFKMKRYIKSKAILNVRLRFIQASTPTIQQ